MTQLAPSLKAPAAKSAPRAPPPQIVQYKLDVGPSGDHFEREADSVAAAVMSTSSAPVTIPPTITPIGAQRKSEPVKKDEEKKPKGSKNVAQRKAAPSTTREEEKKPAAPRGAPAQRKAAPSSGRKQEEPKAGGKGSRMQRESAAGAQGGTASASLDNAVQAMRSGPAPGLDGATRSFMEGRFGRDFGDVRVHHDAAAARAADSVGAQAFTTGSDIFFNRGQYQPHSSSGRKLLAHELTHTIQQKGAAGTAARKRIQRNGPQQPPPPPNPNEATVTTFNSTRLPGASIDTTNVGQHKGTITLPALGLPRVAGALKGTAGGVCAPVAAASRSLPAAGQAFVLDPVGARDETSQAYQVWTDYARANLKTGVRAKVQELITGATDAASIVENGNPVYYLTFKSRRVADQANIFIGTVDELADSDSILRPQWNAAGQSLMGRGNTLDADHILELQIGGADEGSNMWLLKGEYNSRVGSRLKTNIENDLRTLRNEVATVTTIPDSEKPQSESEMKRSWVIRFTTVQEGNNFGATTTEFWTQGQVRSGDPLNQLKVMSEADLVRAGLRLAPGQRPTEIKIFPSPAGGRMARMRLAPDGVNLAAPGFLYTNMFAESGTYNHADSLDAADGPLMTLNVVINKTQGRGPQRQVIAEKRGTINVLRSPRLGIAGYISRESIRSALSSMDFEPLSPLTFADMSVSPEGELVGTGSVLSSKDLLPGLNVPLVLRGDRIMLNFPVPTDGMNLGPLSVTEASISLGVGASEGLFLEGYAGFALGNVGTGSVVATITDQGPRLTGTFNVAMDFLNPASVSVTYDFGTDALSAQATLGVQQGRIPGLDSGQVTIGFTRDQVNVAGTLNLGGPLRGTVVNVTYNQTEGLKIGADNIPLPLGNIPAIQNATLSLSATRSPDSGAWSFAGTGTATLAVPGATGTITISYLDGNITFTANAQVAKGPATGTLNFTATNREIDEEGRPVEGPPTDTISVWGRGSVTIRFGNVLTGTAGVELTPDNRVIVSGAIGLPPVFELFPRREYNRDLFTLSPPEFPIWGVSVAGVGVGVFAFVDARVAFRAYVGPGEIRDAQIGATIDLDRPEDATVTGHAQFVVPAYAGLSLDVGGGLRARVAVAFAEGRVGLTGELGIEAGASAAIDIAWNRNDGLEISADLVAEARPKFELSASASVTVGVDLVLTEVTHTFGPWRRVLGSFGPDMTLGVRMPVRWSEAEGLDLDLDDIEVQQPSLDASGLMTSVMEQLAG